MKLFKMGILFKTMFILSLVLISPVVSGKTCDELTKSAIELELLLNNTVPETCSGGNLKNCCDPKIPGSCLSISEAKAQYNKDLSNLNLIESLIAIGQSVENDHRVLKRVSKEKLKEAKGKIDKYLSSIEKAELIDSALGSYKNKSDNSGRFLAANSKLWVNYQGESPQDMVQHLEQKCSDKEFEEFCSKMGKIEDNKFTISSEKSEKHALMLNNFARSMATHLDIEQSALEDKMSKFKKYLKVSSDTEENISYDKLAGQEGIKPYIALKEQIKKYEENPSDELSTSILSKVNSLPRLRVNFQDSQLTDDGIQGSFKKFTKEEIAKDFTNIQSVSGLITGDITIKDNLKATKELMDNDLKVQYSDAKAYLKNVPSALNEHKDSCSDISDLKKFSACIKKVCPINDLEAKDKCGGTSNTLNLKKKFVDILLAEKTKKKHSELESCFEQKQASQKLECAKKLQLPSSTLGEAQNKVLKSRENLNKLKGANPVKQYIHLKYLTLASLDKEGCLDSAEQNTSKETSSYCKTPDLNGHINTILTLGDDVNKLTLSLDIETQEKTYEKLYGSGADIETLKAYNARSKEDCKKHNQAQGLCDYLQASYDKQIKVINDAKIKEQNKKEKYRKRNKNIQQQLNEIDSGPSSFNYAAQGLAIGLAQNVSGVVQYIGMKRSHERQMDYYQNLYDYRQNLYSADNSIYNNQYYWTNYDPINFQSTPNYIDLSSFQYNFTPIQSNFTTNNTLTPALNPISTSTTTTGSTTVNTGFTF